MFVKLMMDGEKIGDKKKVDTTEETYRLLNPVVSKLDNGNKKENTRIFNQRKLNNNSNLGSKPVL